MSDSYTSPDDVLFADPRLILAEAIKAYLPPERINTADYAAKHRILDNHGGGYVGRWNHDEAPFLVGPMEALDELRFLNVAVVGPARSGKTTIGQNWILKSVDVDPADFLVYAQTDDVIESYVKREIAPMIDLHPQVKEKLGLRPVDNSLKFKRFRAMWIEFLAAAYNNLINKSAPRIIMTEIDAYPANLGDPCALASIRRETFGQESMLLAESHPDRANGLDPSLWTDGIMKQYADSDRRLWWWPCPHCNGYSSPNPTASVPMTLHWEAEAPLDEIAESAALLCPHCGTLIEDKWRRAMNRDGVWVGHGQEISTEGEVTGDLVKSRTAGFWITGLMSPFVIGGVGSLAYDMAKAQRAFEATGDDKDLRAVTVKRWGLPYQAKRVAGSLDAGALAARAEPGLRLGFVPEGVRFLTAAVDIQANRFELLVRGWGVNGESWVIDDRIIAADPATSLNDWDKLLISLEEAQYPLADGSGRCMKILGVGYDSGGQDGVTLQAYGAWRRSRKRRGARRLGKFDGRDGWTILPLKGASSFNAPTLVVTYPDSQRKDRMAHARGEVPVGFFNPNRFKDDLSTQLQKGEPGPWYVHFPGALLAAEPTHPFFEQLVAEQRRPDGRWEKATSAARNERTDLMVMNNVVAYLFGIARIKWESPPAWAAPWDQNSLVMVPEVPSDETGSGASVASRVVTQAAPSPTSGDSARRERLRRMISRMAR